MSKNIWGVWLLNEVIREEPRAFIFVKRAKVFDSMDYRNHPSTSQKSVAAGLGVMGWERWVGSGGLLPKLSLEVRKSTFI